MKVFAGLLLCLPLVWGQVGLDLNVTVAFMKTVEEIVGNSSTLILEEISKKLYELSQSESNQLIFPGTKWCGAGNISNSEDDLGKYNETDACCRTHDHCPDSIASGETKYCLTGGNYTRSRCECDQRFYNCLKGVNTTDSTLVGTSYFDFLGEKCFELDYPISGCKKNATVLTKNRCVEYEFDKTKPKEWQLFDQKQYWYPQKHGSE